MKQTTENQQNLHLLFWKDLKNWQTFHKKPQVWRTSQVGATRCLRGRSARVLPPPGGHGGPSHLVLWGQRHCDTKPRSNTRRYAKERKPQTSDHAKIVL